jgi:hypothetical protein
MTLRKWVVIKIWLSIRKVEVEAYGSRVGCNIPKILHLKKFMHGIHRRLNISAFVQSSKIRFKT